MPTFKLLHVLYYGRRAALVLLLKQTVAAAIKREIDAVTILPPGMLLTTMGTAIWIGVNAGPAIAIIGWMVYSSGPAYSASLATMVKDMTQPIPEAR